jgi:mannose-1-phosphate guanylyltransferase
VRAILLCAGRGVRFRPVTERIPKPLLPFLNVPVAVAHLRRLHEAGIREVAVNLHHLGDEVERHLRDQAAQLPQLTFFREPRLLGTAGALRNAALFLRTGDFLVVNSDAALEPDFSALIARHRESGRAATLLVTENRDPDHYTPLQAEGDRITAFGVYEAGPLLYTGVCVFAPRVLARIPAGETSLVADLWQPLLEGRGGPAEELGFLFHHGPHADLGRPGDFLRATLETLDRGGPFPGGGGSFADRRRLLAQDAIRNFVAERSVLGRARIGSGASIKDSAVWDGAVLGDGAVLDRCILASGRVAPGAQHEKALLWAGGPGDAAVSYPIDV